MNDDFFDAFGWLIEKTENQNHPEARAQAYALQLFQEFAKAFDVDEWPRMTEPEQEAFVSGFVPLCGGD